MKRSKLSRVLIVILAALTVFAPTAAGAEGSSSSGSTSSIDEVRELLEAQSYFDYLEENTALGRTDGEGSMTIKATEGFTYTPDEDYGDGETAAVVNVEGEGEALLTPNIGTVSWQITIPKTGLYTIRLTYMPYETSNTSTMERVLRIDGKVPFKEANYFEFTRSFIDEYSSVGGLSFEKDINGNDKRPVKTEIFEKSEAYLSDSAGYHVEPFKFAFTEGEHTLALEASMNEMYIFDIVIEKYNMPIAYDSYIEQYAGVPAVEVNDENTVRFEGEYTSKTSDMTIYALNDRTSPITSPQDYALQLLNTIGGAKWQNIGQWIEWTIPADSIKQSGLYYIVPRFSQATLAGLYVSRRIYINGEIPFAEASYLQFNYSDDWQTSPLNDGSKDLMFYFEAGRDYTIRMEVVYGNMADILRRCEFCLSEMNDIYNSILKITGPTPDEHMDYGFAEQIYDTILQMRDTKNELQAIVNEFMEISGGRSGADIATLEKVIFILNRMSTDEDEIAKNLENLKINSGTLGTWIMTTKLQPLTIDYVSIQPVGAEIPRANANFWESLMFELRSFFASFLTDYNSLGSSAEDLENTAEPVEVWIATSRDEAQVMRELIDNKCVDDQGRRINVTLKLVAAGTLLPATLSGIGPDISLAMGQSDVINYAIRNAIEPLSDFDGYMEYVSNTNMFNPETLVGLQLQNPDTGEMDYYGVPERLGFVMMFYRKDIFADFDMELPRTWDDLIGIVPDLQAEYRDVGMATSLGGLQLLMYQQDIDLYKDNGMRINIDANDALSCFKELCDMFTSYKFPRIYDLATYFRMGTMPVAIADYLSYNQFSIYATEIKGLWEFVPVPGTLITNADGTTTINNSVPCSVSATVLMADENRSEELAKNCWQFIKWWTGAEAQSEYAKQYEALIGMAAKYNTANMQALNSMPWTTSEKQNLEAQFKNLKGTPEYPGGYIITRYVDFAFLDAYNNGADPVDSLLDNIIHINKELSRKREEFGLETYEQRYPDSN